MISSNKFLAICFCLMFAFQPNFVKAGMHRHNNNDLTTMLAAGLVTLLLQQDPAGYSARYGGYPVGRSLGGFGFGPTIGGHGIGHAVASLVAPRFGGMGGMGLILPLLKGLLF